MSGYALYDHTGQLQRFRRRYLHPAERQTPARRIVAQRELATATHIPGDLSADEIDRRFDAALQQIRWRRHADRLT